MEIILAILAEVLGWILQLFGELFLQLFVEAIARMFGHIGNQVYARQEPTRPWVAAIGYLIFGTLAGALSLLVFPNLFIKPEWLRVLNLVVTPVIAGVLMGLVGAWRRKHDKTVIRIESFSYGLCFAAGMALVRHVYAN